MVSSELGFLGYSFVMASYHNFLNGIRIYSFMLPENSSVSCISDRFSIFFVHALNISNQIFKILNILVSTVLPRKSGHAASPNIRDRITVVSGYLG